MGYGLEASYYFPQGDSLDLVRETRALIAQLQHQNPGMRVQRDSREVQVGVQRGLLTTFTSRSPFQGETEIDSLISVPRPEGPVLHGVHRPWQRGGTPEPDVQ